MRLNVLLTVAAIYMALVGLGLILVPESFGRGAVPPNASDALIAYLRLWGSPLLGIAVLDWMARNAGPSKTREAIVLGNMVGFAVIAAIDLWGLASGARELTKVFAVVHLLFAAAFLLAEIRGRSATVA
jgi:hypothetical protein